MIRRKSFAVRQPKDCSHYRQMMHEYANQAVHDRRGEQPGHDPTPCWCCCDDCSDLTWFHAPRKGVWWVPGPSGELRSTRETSAE